MLHLYRGDSIYNKKTQPGLYRGNGLTSAAFGGGGDPMNIEKKGLLETVKEHIDHIKGYEREYYSITDYISFSENWDTAKCWAADRNPNNLIPCLEPYQETRYIFHLKIPKSEIKEISTGVWEFHFACNKNLKTANNSKDILTTYALTYHDCPVCNSVLKAHSIILVQTTLFIPNLKDDKYKRAKKLSDKNDEWLILPNDLDHHVFKHRTTRIPRADFWIAEHYNLDGETRDGGNIETHYT